MPSVEGLVVACLLVVTGVLVALWKIKPTQYKAGDDGSRHGGDTRKGARSVQIVVLGDIGRSPRMQYHATSLAARGVRVDIVGFQESELHPDLRSNPRVTVYPLPPPPDLFQTSNKLAFLVFGPTKAVWQALMLFHTLAYRSPPAEWIMVQNPPSIPTLAVSALASYLRNTKLVIDWHNFGWSVLALKLGPSHLLVKVARLYEYAFARAATQHFAVTRAMSAYLRNAASISAHPLHDRPAASFRPLTAADRASFLSSLDLTAPYAPDILSGARRLVVSSTSWTPDEDFSLLLDALVDYSTASVRRPAALPPILAIITGKGPQRAHYLRRLAALSDAGALARVDVATAWLPAARYAALLGAADLGVSLHRSTSGVDLPMKVVDMFGAGLPVVGFDAYEAWPELVREGVNGRGFRSAAGLEALLEELFADGGAALEELKRGAKVESRWRWEDEWSRVAWAEVFGVD